MIRCLLFFEMNNIFVWKTQRILVPFSHYYTNKHYKIVFGRPIFLSPNKPFFCDGIHAHRKGYDAI